MTQESVTHDVHPFGKVLKGALVVFLPAAALFGAMFYGFYMQKDQSARELVFQSEQQRITIMRQLISDDLHQVSVDLKLFSEYPTLAEYVDRPFDSQRERLVRSFSRIMRSKKIYDQVRLLDTKGLERLRVDYNGGRPIAIPGDQLQDKSDRYYFKEAIGLEPGRLAMSRFDLNIEHGEVSWPFKPVLRVSTPLFNKQGERFGILVLNYQGQRILEHIERLSQNSNGDILLVDSEGYWLRGYEKDDEWGFMFDGHQERTMRKRYPEQWKEMNEEKDGVTGVGEGIFIFTSLQPVHDGLSRDLGVTDQTKVKMRSDSVRWYLVAHVTEGLIQQQLAPFKRVLLISYVSILLVIGIIAVSFSKSQLHGRQAEEAMRRSEEIYRRLAANFPAGFVFLFDRSLRCVVAEGRGLNELGVSAGYVAGRPLTEFFAAGESADILPRYAMVFDGKDSAFEFTLQGRVFDVQALPIRGQRGEVIHGMAVVQDVTEQKRLEQELRQAATRDELTGLYNRRRLMERLDEVMGMAVRYEQPLSVCVCDIDYFKNVNDTHGHLVGDQLLARFASIVAEEIRAPDFCGRYGGDEFCMVFPNTTKEHALRSVERIRKRLEDDLLALENGHSVAVTGSFGIGELKSGAMTVQELFELSDAALYKAKNAGRNRTEML